MAPDPSWSVHQMESEIGDAVGNAKLDLELELDERPEGHIAGRLIYDRDLFEAATAAEWLGTGPASSVPWRRPPVPSRGSPCSRRTKSTASSSSGTPPPPTAPPATSTISSGREPPGTPPQLPCPPTGRRSATPSWTGGPTGLLVGCSPRAWHLATWWRLRGALGRPGRRRPRGAEGRRRLPAARPRAAPGATRVHGGRIRAAAVLAHPAWAARLATAPARCSRSVHRTMANGASPPVLDERGPGCGLLPAVHVTGDGETERRSDPPRSVVNLATAMAADLGIGPADTVLVLPSTLFEVPVFELWMALIAGARMVVAPADVAGDGAHSAG